METITINGIDYVSKESLNNVTSDSQNGNCFLSLIGDNYFFRTVTYHVLGKVVGVFNNFVVLEQASWVADSGRFMNFIKDGTVDEVEPVGRCYVNLDSVVDFFKWNHDLFTEQK